MIANNRQLAKIIRLKPTSREALGRVEGIGEAKIAKYGDQILEILTKHLPEFQPMLPIKAKGPRHET